MGKKHKQKKSGPAEKSPGRSPVDPQVLWQNGLAQFQQDNYVKAAAEWQKIPAALRSPQITAALAETHFHKALNIYQQPDFEPEKSYNQIISELAHAINLQPEKPLYHFHLGLAYHRQGKLDKAASAYRKACQLQPDERFLFHLILANLKRNELQNAAECLEPYTEGFRRNLLGITISLLKKEAPGELKVSSTTTPQQENLFAGLLLLIDGKPLAAIPLFEQALISPKTDAQTSSQAKGMLLYYLGLAQRSASPGQVEESEKNWERALQSGLLGAGLQKSSVKENLAAMLWEQGMKFARNREYVKAHLAWEKALSIKPHHKPLLKNLHRLKFLMGNEAAQRGDFAEAIKLWQAIPQQGDVDLFHNIAVAYDHFQKPREANSHWIEVVKYWKKDYRTGADKTWMKDYLIIAHKHLAENYVQLDDPRSAIRELQEVLRYDPNDVECHNRLGDLYMELENWPLARREFEAALRIKPDAVDASLNLAFALEMFDEVDAARSTLENILKFDPNHAPAKKQLGELLHEQAHERWEDEECIEAGDLFEQQIKLDPLNFSGYKCLALMDLDELADEKTAEGAFQRYIAAHSGSASAYVDVGAAYLEADRSSKAEKYFKQAEKMGATSPELFVEMGRAYLGTSVNKARSYFDKAVQAAPNDASLCRKICSLLAPKDPARGLQYLQKSLKIDGSNPEVYAEMGLVQTMSGNRREADKAWFMAKQMANKQGNQRLLEEIVEMQKSANEFQEMFEFLRDL
jgi:tetratricopeptide (TPR) repeat protein